MPARTLKQAINSIPTTDGGSFRLLRSLGQSHALRLDPFLMLDKFSSMNADDYIAGFPDHPHRGFETVTYKLHQDYLGNRGGQEQTDGSARLIEKKVENAPACVRAHLRTASALI